jgi:LacI family transcriptional regulator
MTSKNTPKKVAVLISPDWPNAAASLSGIMDYAETKPNWRILHLPPSFLGGPKELWDFEADGALGYVNSEAEAEICRNRHMPMVSLGSAHLKPGSVPRVLVDNEAIGRMTANHFIERRFRRLALVRTEDNFNDDVRRHGFLEAAAEAEVSVSLFDVQGTFTSWSAWDAVIERLEQWLRGLTYPVGVVASDDTQARKVLLACRNLKLRVPEDVAVLGVGNNERICKYCKPKLSSINMPGYKIGQEAAKLLDGLMQGERRPSEDLLVAPGEVSARRSTRVLGIDNDHVRTAVLHINAQAGESFGVAHLASLVPVSRRTLETLFREELGCTPHEFLSRVRVKKAQVLLVSHPRMMLQDVATECGFSSSKHLRQVFEARVGKKPMLYRREHV